MNLLTYFYTLLWMKVSPYPRFDPLDIEMQSAIQPRLSTLKDGISEFTFANLYLFRKKYRYTVSSLPGDQFIFSGEENGKKFFLLPSGIPEKEILDEMFKSHDCIKCLPESSANQGRVLLEQDGYCVVEDRDNFDYIYCRRELAQLPGRKYHKKRNLVNAFINNYTYEEMPLTAERKKDALNILKEWAQEKGGDGDYEAAEEGLEKMDILKLCGYVYYVDGRPAAYILGEEIARGKMFAVHFEKALSGYKGLYQFINKSFASILPHHYRYINREQDLGDDGLRQAKMSYRPCGFIKKYRVYRSEECPSLVFKDTKM